MKILACILLCSTILCAQHPTSKGNVSLGGKISYTNMNVDSYTYQLLEFSPQVSYFVGENVEYGIAVTVQSLSQAGSSSQSYAGIGPIVNVYFTENNTKPFIGAGYSYSSAPYGRERVSMHQYLILAGFSIELNAHVALQPLVQFSYHNNERSRPVRQTMFGVSVKAFL